MENKTQVRISSGRKKAGARASIAIVAALVSLLAVAAPAEAAGNRSVTGNINCTAFPNITIGTTATAKGQVEFSLNKYNNSGTLGTVKLGTSSAYANWGWKWWSGQAGTFTAFAWGSSGAVSAVNRYCQNLSS